MGTFDHVVFIFIFGSFGALVVLLVSRGANQTEICDPGLLVTYLLYLQ